MKKLFSLLAWFLLLICFSTCQEPDPSKSINLQELTIEKIHSAYKNGTYTSRDLVAAYITAISEKNDSINALTAINPDALDIAEKLDKEFNETGKMRPLHGIPIVVKDNINTKGLPTTAGSVALQGFIPDENAFVIKKLVDAGAIILAKSNMAEWAFSPMQTESSTAGITHNPYNLDFVPAGSSGGTAASIAANLGVVGLGTDTGNSIRGPSSHNSLVGFRTTLGLISREGIVPLYLRNDVVGPICRTVEDATKTLEVMAGFDPKDSITAHSRGKLSQNYQQFLQKNGLHGARIGVLRALSDDDPDPEVKALFEKALSDMDSLEAEIIDPVIIPNFDSLRKDQWCSTFKKDVEEFLNTYVKNDSVKTIEDIIRVGTKSDFVRERLKEAANFNGRWGESDAACLDAYHDERRIVFREAIEKVMDSLHLDAIVYPSWNNKPAHIANFAKEYQGDNSQIIAPHTGQPAFTVPMGFTSGNLPAGLQFLGRMYDEPTLIRLSYAYEQGTQHREPPMIRE